MTCPRRASLWVGAFTLLALGLRLVRLDAYSVWYDEAMYLQLAKNAFGGEFIGTLHGRIGTLLLWLWAQGGESDWWLRLLPALLGTATVPVVFLLARYLADEKTALFGTALLAVHPLHIYYSQTIRRETLAVLVMSLAFYFFLRALAFGRIREMVLYAFFGSIALMTLIFSASLILGCGLYALIRARRSKPLLLKWLAIHGVLALVAGSVALSFWLHYRTSQEPVAVSLTFSETAKLIKTLFFGHHLPIEALYPAAALPLVLCLYGLYHMARVDRRLLLFTGLTVVPAIAAALWGGLLGQQVFVFRYYVFLLPTFCFLLAYSLRYLPWVAGAGLAAGLILLLMGISNSRLYDNRPIHELEASQRADYRSMAAWIRKNKRPGDLVAHFHRASRMSVDWYARGEVENVHLLFDEPECHYTNEDNAKMAKRFAGLGVADHPARPTLSGTQYRRVWFVVSQWQPDKRIYFPRRHLWRNRPSEAALNAMKRDYRLIPLEGADKTEDGDGLYFGGMPWVRLYLFDLTEKPGNEGDP